MRRALFVGCVFTMVLMFAACATAPAPQPGAGPLAGTWLLNVQTPMGSGTPKFVLTQDGEQVSGSYAGAFGEAPVTGVVTGDTFELQFVSMGSTMIYKGTIDGNAIEGTVDLGGQSEGTFTGKRQ